MDMEILVEQFTRLSSLFEARQEAYVSLNGNASLTVGEIHLIAAVGNHPAENITGLAKILGNTKGAVSQMAARLQKKRMLKKTRREDNDKEVVLALTKEGQKVYEEHRKFHADLYAELEQYPASLKEVKKLLDVAEKYLNRYSRKDYKTDPPWVP